MFSQFLKRYPPAAFVAIWLACAAAGFAMPKLLAVVDFVEKWLMDLRLTSIGEVMPQRSDIVLFTLTEETLAQFPYRFPVDRGMLADAIDRLNKVGVKAIGIDVLFDQPTESAKDNRLASAVARSAAPVVVGWASEAEELTARQRRYLSDYLPEAIHAPSNLSKDARDGTVRWIFPGTQTATGFRPGFAPALARAVGVESPHEASELYFRRGADGSLQPFRKFPLQLLAHLPPDWYAGKIVLIGADLPNEDRHRTPFAALVGNERGSVPGVVIHAFALAHLLDGAVLPTTGVAFALVLTLVSAGVGVLIALLQTGVLAKTAASVGVFAVLWGGGFALFQLGGPLAPMFAPSVTFAAAISLSAAHITQLYKQKKLFAEAMVQRRNQSLQKMVENSFDGIVVTTSDGIILSANASADRILGREPGEALGMPVGEYVPGIETVATRFLELDTTSRDGDAQAIEPLEMDCVRRDGTAFAMEIIVYTARISFDKSAVVTMGGERVSYIYSFRDVTARRRELEAQKLALAEAEAASRAKTEFLHNMSHELRTPLNAIIGFSDIIKNEMMGPVGVAQYLEYIRDINNSGTHLLQVVNDILDMSKIESGQMVLNENEIYLPHSVDASRRIVEEQARSAGLTLTVDLPRDMPELTGDERMIKQMLLNLLTNAIKFTPEGGSVTVGGETAADGGLVIWIRDTGIGIDAKDFDKVMEPFGQADASLSRGYEGTGLGLPLVKSMIELHGGRFELESEVGVGTKVGLHFPPERTVAPRPAKPKAAVA